MKNDYERAAGVGNHDTQRNIQPLEVTHGLASIGGLAAGLFVVAVLAAIAYIAGVL